MMAKDFINKTIGKPWVNRACGPESYDCWGLVIASFKEIDGITLPTINLYDDELAETSEAGSEGIKNYNTEISTGVHGDIMLMFDADGNFQHVGRVFYGSVLHAWGNGSGRTEQVKFDRISLLKRLYKNKVEFRRYAHHC
jgi:hypothetical protein